jgi:hypothetical protein
MTNALHALALLSLATAIGLFIVGAFKIVFQPRCICNRCKQGE